MKTVYYESKKSMAFAFAHFDSEVKANTFINNLNKSGLFNAKLVTLKAE